MLHPYKVSTTQSQKKSRHPFWFVSLLSNDLQHHNLVYPLVLVVSEVSEVIQALEEVMEDEVTEEVSEEVSEDQDFLEEVVVIMVVASEDLVEWLDPDL